MGCKHSTPVVHPSELTEARNRAIHLLKELNADYLKDYTLREYTVNGLQDAQYSSHMTVEDHVNLDRLWRICEKYSSIRDTKIGELFAENMFNELAQKAETNMINVLNANPDLLKWFKEYNPTQYAFNEHPNLHKLEKLVDNDGHSGASFALCCRAVKNKICV